MSVETKARRGRAAGWLAMVTALVSSLLLAVTTIGLAPAHAADCVFVSCVRGTVTPPPGVAVTDLKVVTVFRDNGRYTWGNTWTVEPDGSYEARFGAQPTFIVFTQEDSRLDLDGPFSVTGGVAPTYYDGGSGAPTRPQRLPPWSCLLARPSPMTSLSGRRRQCPARSPSSPRPLPMRSTA